MDLWIFKEIPWHTDIFQGLQGGMIKVGELETLSMTDYKG